jgi:hypothetical protein
MRIAIVVVLAAVFGGIVGALVARAQLAPELAALKRDNKQLEQESVGALQELSVAAERVAWLEAELADMRRTAPARLDTARRPAAPAPAQPGADPEASAGQSAGPAQPRLGQTNVYEESAPPPPGWEEEEEAIPQATLERRRHAQDILLDELELSNDPLEQDRIANIHNHLRDIRDMFQEMRNAPDVETQQAYSQAIRQARHNLKTLVDDQRADLMRRELEASGITDQAQQREIIQRLGQVQENPFYSEPMFVWGAAPPDPEPLPQE